MLLMVCSWAVLVVPLAVAAIAEPSYYQGLIIIVMVGLCPLPIAAAFLAALALLQLTDPDGLGDLAMAAGHLRCRLDLLPLTAVAAPGGVVVGLAFTAIALPAIRGLGGLSELLVRENRQALAALLSDRVHHVAAE
jgi:hypothetical protein